MKRQMSPGVSMETRSRDSWSFVGKKRAASGPLSIRFRIEVVRWFVILVIMSLSYSYYPDYFSVSDILATEERITTRVEIDLPGLGFLDTSSESRDLKAATKLEMPFWLAHSLNARKRPIVSVEIPKVYKDGYREILEADACAVTLSKWNPHYYELGMCLRQFNNRECEKITDSLLQTFKTRFRLVMDWAQNPISDPTLGSQLPTLEKGLFLAGRRARALLIEWLKMGCGNIETSEVVANLIKKRKRMDF